jgi:hypothetical protein
MYRSAVEQQMADRLEADLHAGAIELPRGGVGIDEFVRNSLVHPAPRNRLRSMGDTSLLIGLGVLMHFAMRRRANGQNIEEIAAAQDRIT